MLSRRRHVETGAGLPSDDADKVQKFEEQSAEIRKKAVAQIKVHKDDLHNDLLALKDKYQRIAETTGLPREDF